MLKTLNLVRGAVSTKELIPILTHFQVKDGTITGSNGRISICAKLPELAGFEFTVPAERFLKAVDACKGEPNLKLTEGGKLSISKGSFRALLPIEAVSAFPCPTGPVGIGFAQNQPLLAALSRLAPFVSEDASRPWSCGILIRGGFAYATNNVTVARIPIPLFEEFDNIVLPTSAVDELLRIGQEPHTVWREPSSVVFGLNGAWLQTQLVDNAWPGVEKLFKDNRENCKELDKELVDAVKQVVPFCPDSKLPIIMFTEEGVATMEGNFSAKVGLGGLPAAVYNATPLLKVLSAATHFDPGFYPDNAPFFGGGGLEGYIVGVRLQ